MASFYDLLAPPTGPNPSATYDIYEQPRFGRSPVLTQPSQAGMVSQPAGWTRWLQTLLGGQGRQGSGGMQAPVAPSMGSGAPSPRPVQDIGLNTIMSLASLVGLGGTAGSPGPGGGGQASMAAIFGAPHRGNPPSAAPPALARPLIPQQQTTLASPRRFG